MNCFLLHTDVALYHTIYKFILCILFLISICLNVVLLYKLKSSVLLKIKLNRKLEKLQKDSDDYALMSQMVTHDLRAPINAIHWMARRLINRLRPTGDELQMLEVIRDVSRISYELIEGMIYLPNTRHSERQTDIQDLSQLLSTSLGICSHQIESKQIRLALNLKPVMICSNYNEVIRAVCNVLSNAIKVSPVEGLLTVDVTESNQRAVLSIQDQGPGIDQRLGENIFNAYQSSDKNISPFEKSLGLGLFISKKLIEANQGKISYRSTQGQGSIFYIDFPALTAVDSLSGQVYEFAVMAAPAN